MQPRLHNSADHGISKCLPAPSSSCLGLPTIHRDHRTSSEQVPCLRRAKHESKETCNLLQQVGVRDSYRYIVVLSAGGLLCCVSRGVVNMRCVIILHTQQNTTKYR